jgi:hypothetical protein
MALGTLGGQNDPQVFSQDLFSADPEDPSPEDQTAHINGLIVQACRRPRHMRKATKTEASAI